MSQKQIHGLKKKNNQKKKQQHIYLYRYLYINHPIPHTDSHVCSRPITGTEVKFIMSSTPTSSVSNEVRSPPYVSDHTSASLQPPYGLRLSTLLTLPPPQNPGLSAASSSQLYHHPLNYPSQTAATQPLNNTNKSQFQRYGFLGADPFNYPSLALPPVAQVAQGVPASQASQKFQLLPQVSLQNLPQTGFPLSPSAFPIVPEKAVQASFNSNSPQGQYQSFAPQAPQPQGPFPLLDIEPKSMPVNGTLSLNTGHDLAYAKEILYPSSDTESVKSSDQNSYTHSQTHTPKFVHSKHSKNPKGIKGTKMRFASALAPEHKPYVCNYEGCTWAFARPSDLRRHLKSHNAPDFHCPYWKNDPTCHRNGGSFTRMDVLKRHLRLVHYIKDKEKAFGGADPGWCRACQKLFPSSKTFISHCDECASQVAPAEWKASSALKDPSEQIDQ